MRVGPGPLGNQVLPVGRLSGTGAATNHRAVAGTTLRWIRGGTTREAWRTEFDLSADGGAPWTSLGAGTRIPGGWGLTVAALPADASVRARGFVAGSGDAGYFVESVLVRGNGPSLSELHVAADGSFTFVVAGRAGWEVFIDVSEDLRAWTPLGVVVIGTQGSVRFTDPDRPSYRLRYYRGRLP